MVDKICYTCYTYAGKHSLDSSRMIPFSYACHKSRAFVLAVLLSSHLAFLAFPVALAWHSMGWIFGIPCTLVV